jgi:hypothetical protein
VQVGDVTRVDFEPEITTSVDGRFSTRRAIKVSSDYIASVEPPAQACAPQSTALGGCLSQTIVAPQPAFATVFVRGRRDAVRAYTRSGQARAAATLPRLVELPTGAAETGPGVHICEGKHASKSS